MTKPILVPDKSHMRFDSLDTARGVLLVAMLATHIVSAHGSSNHVGFLHGSVGVFLISSGFVGLSGFLIGFRTQPWRSGEGARALESALRLLLVMFGYGVLVSLSRHGLALLGSGPEACSAQQGWLPPLRFDDLGILLPIAIVQLLAPLARMPGRLPRIVLGAFIAGFVLLPSGAISLPDQGILGGVADVLVRRKLTPFYTVVTFVAIGLSCALLGRLSWTALRQGESGSVRSVAAAIVAIVLASPHLANAALDPVFGLNRALGAFAQLAYWLIAISFSLRPFAAPFEAGGTARHVMSLLGRHSLLVFVAHDFLLVLNAAGRRALGTDKGIAAIVALLTVDLALLFALCVFVERRESDRQWFAAILLESARVSKPLRGGAFSIPGGLALAGIFASYSGTALSGADGELPIDRTEDASCPAWWAFGPLGYHQTASEPGSGRAGHHLQVRGPAAVPYAQGRGLFLDREIGDRRALQMSIRGHGPHSGRMKIELSEDDNNNWEIEKSPPLYVPLVDDRVIYEIAVDWYGWRDVAIPLSAFRDDNPGKGNDVFDPHRDLTSDGLLELQILFASAGAPGDETMIDLDDIRWMK